MDKRQFLIYVLGYLNGINSLKKISNDKVSKITELINAFRAEQNRRNNFSDQDEYDPDYDEKYDHNSLYNNPNYDPESDLDQQGPDFDF